MLVFFLLGRIKTPCFLHSVFPAILTGICRVWRFGTCVIFFVCLRVGVFTLYHTTWLRHTGQILCRNAHCNADILRNLWVRKLVIHHLLVSELPLSFISCLSSWNSWQVFQEKILPQTDQAADVTQLSFTFRGIWRRVFLENNLNNDWLYTRQGHKFNSLIGWFMFCLLNVHFLLVRFCWRLNMTVDVITVQFE